jgi:hypothetical protein
MVLALQYLTTFRDKYATRTWKGMDWGAMDRLHEKGHISNSKGKAKSVRMTEEGERLTKELFTKHFGKK